MLIPGVGLIPPPEKHGFYWQCPSCQGRIWYQLFTTMLAYKIHYMNHVLETLEHDVDMITWQP
jgi:C4-type Zn-finger protein